jgi:hypothetical protein
VVGLEVHKILPRKKEFGWLMYAGNCCALRRAPAKIRMKWGFGQRRFLPQNPDEIGASHIVLSRFCPPSRGKCFATKRKIIFLASQTNDFVKL